MHRNYFRITTALCHLAAVYKYTGNSTLSAETLDLPTLPYQYSASRDKFRVSSCLLQPPVPAYAGTEGCSILLAFFLLFLLNA